MKQKIQRKYFGNPYDVIEPLISMDFSECALEQALIDLKYKFGQEYILHIGRVYLRDIVNLTKGLHIFSILIELEEDLVDEWYLVDEENKRIFYSSGA